MKIGVDLLGSESSPQALLQAALGVCLSHDFQLHAFGPKISLNQKIVWHESNLAVSMEKSGVLAAEEQETSMLQGIKALKEGTIDAFISCGNTAALLTYAHLHLEKLPFVKRLGLLAQVGTEQGRCLVIDVGANISSNLHQLHQFALMAKAAFRALYDKDPLLAILNIAKEKTKGPKTLIELFNLLENDPSFYGFAEPDEIFKGLCDVVITEGFAGNIFLKTAEAVAQMTLGEDTLSSYNPSSYPGALLCGAQNLVMKCHGKGNTRALQKTIEEVIRLKSRNYLTRVRQEISALKEESF